MSKTWKAILGVILIFIFGWLSGVLSTSLFVRHKTLDLLKGGPEGVTEILERRMLRDLDLDANQKQQIHDYFMTNLTQRKQLQKEIQPQVQMLNRQTIKEIDAVLRPDQQERFHENIVQFKRRFGKNPFKLKAEEDPSAPRIQSGGPATNSGASSPP